MNPNEPRPEQVGLRAPEFLENVRYSSRDPGGAKLMLTWLALIAATLALFIPANFHTRATTPPPVEEADSWTLRLLGRYLVGAGQMAKASGMSSDQLLAAMHENIDGRRIDPADVAAKREFDLDRLRATAIVAELAGKEAAVARLDEFADSPSFDPELKPDIEAFRAAYADGPSAVTDDQRKILADRHGWFGELALSFGLPETDPARVAALAPCARTITAVLAAGAIGILALLAGFVLFIIGIVLLASGRLTRRYQRNIGLSEKERRVLLETPIVLMAGLIGVHALIDALNASSSPDVRTIAGLIGLPLQFVLAAVVLWPMLRGFTFTRLRQAYGWHFGAGLFREIAAGLIGYLAGLPIVAAGFLLVLMLLAIQSAITGHTATPSHPVVEEAGSAGVFGALLLYLLASGWAPVVEEAAFRGAFFRHMRWWAGPVGSGVVTGFFFAAVHPQGWAVIPALAALGLVFALIREWRGSLIGPMVAHGVHNAMLVTMMLLILT